MRSSVARVGKVTLKGGATLHIIEGGSQEATYHFLQNAEAFPEIMGNTLAGFALVGWDFKGRYARAFFCHHDSPIQATRMPGYVHDVLLKEATETSLIDLLTNGPGED